MYKNSCSAGLGWDPAFFPSNLGHSDADSHGLNKHLMKR